MSIITSSIGLLCVQLLFSSSIIALSSSLISGFKYSTIYIYKYIRPEQKKILNYSSYEVITQEKIDDIDPELKKQLIEKYGDNFLIITNKTNTEI